MITALRKLQQERAALAALTVEGSIQRQGQLRYEHGLAKYGVTLDRNDLTQLEWLQHLKEEMMDGIRYVEAAQRDLECVAAAVAALPPMPFVKPRAYFLEDKSSPLLESLNDWCDANEEAVEWFLENAEQVRTALAWLTTRAAQPHG